MTKASPSAVRFDGQVAVVTGGGRGIGRETCVEFGRRGASVVVNDLAAEHAQGVVDEIVAAEGSAVSVVASVGSREGAQAIVDAALDSFGRLDVVVNNAGILRNGMFEDIDDERLDALVDVHLRGAFFVTQPAWRVMRQQRYGRVITLGSGSGMFGHQGLTNYAATKASLYGLTKALAFEGDEHGILVNCVMPSTGGTTTIAENQPIPGIEPYVERISPATLRSRASTHPVAQLIAYLGSSNCTLTGEAFSVVAGRFARVFVGVAAGWIAPDVESVTVEDVAAHLDQFRDQSGYRVPVDLYEEIEAVGEAVSQSNGGATVTPSSPSWAERRG